MLYAICCNLLNPFSNFWVLIGWCTGKGCWRTLSQGYIYIQETPRGARSLALAHLGPAPLGPKKLCFQGFLPYLNVIRIFEKTLRPGGSRSHQARKF